MFDSFAITHAMSATSKKILKELDKAKYAKDFVYTENLDIHDKKSEIPVGVSCRTCDRLDCSQRAFPPLHKKFDIDINSRGVSVYVSE